MTARTAVVVVTRDRRDRVLATLDRLVPLGRPITVVDNGSHDGTAEAVRSRHPEVTVRALAGDIGAAARTLGARLAGTPYVAFADDDSWWEPGALDLAEAFLDGNPELALVAGRVLVGPGDRPDPTCEVMARSPLPAPAGLPGRAVLGFLGCAAVVRTAPFLSVGGFHPRFGIGGEETLLATDLARVGWWLAYLPAVVAHHHPPPRADHGPRRRREVRNALWSAWLRRRSGGAIRTTAVVLAHADPRVRWAGAADAVRGLGWVLRERRPVDPALDARLQLLEH
jgi:GT2 family glycosyltransferase